MLNKLIIVFLLSLPFERVLTFDFLGFTIKPPYIAALLLLFYFFLNLKNFSFKLSIPEVLFGLFVLFSFTTVFWSIEPIYTLIISSMFLFMWLILVASKNVVKEKDLSLYLNIFIWLGVLTSVFGIYQFFGDMLGLSQKITLLGDDYIKGVFPFPRIQSTFFEPGFFANFLLIPISLLVYKIQSDKHKFIDLAALLIIITAFFLTLSRGGIIALALGLIIYFIFILSSQKKKIKKVFLSFLSIMLGFICSIIIIFSFIGKNGVQTYFNQLINADDAITLTKENKELVTRSYTINVALDTFREHPFGIGTGAFGALPEFEKIRQEGNQRQTVNSLYPEIMAEQGIIGIIIFALFILSLLYMLLKLWFYNKNILALTFALIVFTIFLQYISFSTLYLVYIWVFLGIVLSLGNKDARQN